MYRLLPPTAASVGKYGDIPVSYHTGVPQIAVPIYTVKEGPLSLPVSISYHAGGIKVMEPAGWCGTGWNLNAGGVISRTVRGVADEALNTGIGIYGHFQKLWLQQLPDDRRSAAYRKRGTTQ
ncbi:MAG: hypothetical protein WDO19_21760 [Bacteroidota bacterium]